MPSNKQSFVDGPGQGDFETIELVAHSNKFDIESPRIAAQRLLGDASVSSEDYEQPAKLPLARSAVTEEQEGDMPQTPKPAPYEPSDLELFDQMLTRMIATYFICLGFGWGLLLFDYTYNWVEHREKDEPWVSDVVIIGGASAILSPIIQWSHTIAQTRGSKDEMTHVRLQFLKRMLAIYVSIVSVSTVVAIIRFSMEERRILHQLIATISNHLVLARISASLLSWGGANERSLQTSASGQDNCFSKER